MMKTSSTGISIIRGLSYITCCVILLVGHKRRAGPIHEDYLPVLRCRLIVNDSITCRTRNRNIAPQRSVAVFDFYKETHIIRREGRCRKVLRRCTSEDILAAA